MPREGRVTRVYKHHQVLIIFITVYLQQLFSVIITSAYLVKDEDRERPQGLLPKDYRRSNSYYLSVLQIFVAILLVGVALARPQNEPQQSDPNAVQILRYENDNSGLGSYRFA